MKSSRAVTRDLFLLDRPDRSVKWSDHERHGLGSRISYLRSNPLPCSSSARHMLQTGTWQLDECRWVKKRWLRILTRTNNRPVKVQAQFAPWYKGWSSEIHKSSSLLITSCIVGLSVGFNIQQSFIRFQILSFAMVSGRFGVPPLATLAITVNIEYSWYGSFLVRTSYMTIPKDHISELVVPTRGLKVSGAIHLTDSMPPGVCFSIVCVTAVGPDTSKAV